MANKYGEILMEVAVRMSGKMPFGGRAERGN